MIKSPHVAIIVVNYNGQKFLFDCLSSIFSQDFTSIEVVLVDNGSTDGSLDLITQFPPITVIKNRSNLGFALANNQAIRQVLTRSAITHVALVNNDAVLTSNWLSSLLTEFESSSEKLGGVVGKILSLKDPTIIDSAGDFADKVTSSFVNRGAGEKDEGQLDNKEEVFSITAAACLYSRAMLEEVELDGLYFDESFFAYFEDVDLCLRAHLLGWKFYYVPQAVAYHYGSATSSTMEGKKVFLCRRNRIWLAVKSLPLLDLIWLMPRYILPTFGKSRYRKGKKFLAQLPLYLSSMTHALRLFPLMVHQRKKIQSRRTASREEIMKWFHSQSL